MFNYRIMAFAFPAYHTDKFVAPSPDVNLVKLTQTAVQHLGWILIRQNRDSIVYSTRRRMVSRCERVTIQFHEADRSLSIESKCVLLTQCLDWGKNRKNVEVFLQVLQALIQAQAQAQAQP